MYPVQGRHQHYDCSITRSDTTPPFDSTRDDELAVRSMHVCPSNILTYTPSKTADPDQQQRNGWFDIINWFLEDLDANSGIEPSTVCAYFSILGYFEEFCENRGIDDLAELSAPHLRKWKHWRRDHGNDLEDGKRLSAKTLYDDLYMTRKLIKWLSRMDIVPYRLIDKRDIIQLDDEDEV